MTEHQQATAAPMKNMLQMMKRSAMTCQ